MTRIVLFDVDNTLLYSGGAGSLAMRRAFQELYGIEDGFQKVEFSGRTDWGILRDAMRQHDLLDGNERDRFRDELPRFLETYYGLLPAALQEATGGRVMPGVVELLEALSQREGVRMGLGTGNFREAAFMKLRHFGLDGYLADGGFGNDAEERGKVIAMGIERVAGGDAVDPRAVWVVGDTVLDVAAAKANGVRVLGVATGSTPLIELQAAGAHVTMRDLSDTEAVLSALVG